MERPTLVVCWVLGVAVLPLAPYLYPYTATRQPTHPPAPQPNGILGRGRDCPGRGTAMGRPGLLLLVMRHAQQLAGGQIGPAALGAKVGARAVRA
eukprot:scaffold26219_cov28-Tisochrysis_lutea.AAC.1